MNISVLTSILLFLYGCTSAASAAGCYNTYNCKVDPCTFFDPLQCNNHPGVQCKPNYCAGCIAELWENGVKVTDCIDLTTLG